jgi:hypothetical protein
MGTLADIEIRFSGGITNTTPSASIGGAMSTDAGDGEMLSQSATALTTLTGVVINNAAGNAVGGGTLTYTHTGQTLKWQDAGGTVGTAVAVGTDGDYAIQAGGGGFLDVTVTAASLPGANTTNTSTIANVANDFFDDVSKAESNAGDVEYRCFYYANAHASDEIVGNKLWIDTNTPGQDVILIALDPAGKNGTAASPADESTAPAGVVWTANPIDEDSALDLGDLSAGDNYPFWVRRTVPAETDVATAENTVQLAFKGRF